MEPKKKQQVFQALIENLIMQAEDFLGYQVKNTTRSRLLRLD